MYPLRENTRNRTRLIWRNSPFACLSRALGTERFPVSRCCFLRVFSDFRESFANFSARSLDYLADPFRAVTRRVQYCIANVANVARWIRLRLTHAEERERERERTRIIFCGMLTRFEIDLADVLQVSYKYLLHKHLQSIEMKGIGGKRNFNEIIFDYLDRNARYNYAYPRWMTYTSYWKCFALEMIKLNVNCHLISRESSVSRHRDSELHDGFVFVRRQYVSAACRGAL